VDVSFLLERKSAQGFRRTLAGWAFPRVQGYGRFKESAVTLAGAQRIEADDRKGSFPRVLRRPVHYIRRQAQEVLVRYKGHLFFFFSFAFFVFIEKECLRET